jgi:hypothetical protein
MSRIPRVRHTAPNSALPHFALAYNTIRCPSWRSSSTVSRHGDPSGSGARRIGQWIELTADDGSQLRINLDNVTHLEARTIEGKGYAHVHLTSGEMVTVREDLREVALKMQNPVPLPE